MTVLKDVAFNPATSRQESKYKIFSMLKELLQINKTIFFNSCYHDLSSTKQTNESTVITVPLISKKCSYIITLLFVCLFFKRKKKERIERLVQFNTLLTGIFILANFK